jgi:hypothetical protein
MEFKRKYKTMLVGGFDSEHNLTHKAAKQSYLK